MRYGAVTRAHELSERVASLVGYVRLGAEERRERGWCAMVERCCAWSR